VATSFVPLTDADLRIVAALYPRLAPATAVNVYPVWIKQGFDELDKWRFRADQLGD
jgi:hypothetical protein